MGRIFIMLFVVLCGCTKDICQRNCDSSAKKTPDLYVASDSLYLDFYKRYKGFRGKVIPVGAVSTPEAACKIARAVLVPIYGKRIEDDQPFIVAYLNDIWYVEGSLPEEVLGGSFYIEIRREDAKILRVLHFK